ncbi:PQQ-dependent sugar dehydrogenase [Altererythrobacter lutimaris]|uniref:PQQ-dependent sugar dehydrogenase n=1 Tax=Altererythrobacter lutimaris TaxID=2743979 RepID=A0A850HBH6_9SPHN|nr:PQQ-dependent sugar dehydrogenase [Altererythrobacter lutimaris]NVE94615.1 PQQ-dependent sugar dehydrogenase [Altererythrobacter lutimaris]
MTIPFNRTAILFPAALVAASCSAQSNGETQTASSGHSVAIEEFAEFNEPWAAAFIPATRMLAVTEKAGTIKVIDTGAGTIMPVSGAPEVDYGGQGGLGDIAFLESEAALTLDAPRTIYLTWAEAGDGNTRGAVMGKGQFLCSAEACAISELEVVWRQTPKTSRRGHYSHRIAIAPDESYLFLASGDRQELEPAQDNSNNLGTVVRLNLDGSTAEGNPFAADGGVTSEIWSYGHRNILGMDWDADGRLWDVEHGPAGGDELNLVAEGANYGWPTRSYGNHYSGKPIPDHSEDDGFTKPAITWTPVIAPGDMVFYDGDMFTEWKGQALIAGLQSLGVVRVAIDGETASEAERIDLDERARAIDIGPDGAVWVLTDGEEGKLIKLTAE